MKSVGLKSAIVAFDSDGVAGEGRTGPSNMTRDDPELDQDARE